MSVIPSTADARLVRSASAEDRAASGCLEELNEVAGRILHEGLAATVALHHIVAEPATGRSKGGDRRIEIIHPS